MSTITTNARWICEKDVNALTGLSLSTLRAHRFKGIGIPYSKIGRVTISSKTLSNEDALGRGPMPRVRIGSKVGYTREAIMGYLRRKIKNI